MLSLCYQWSVRKNKGSGFCLKGKLEITVGSWFSHILHPLCHRKYGTESSALLGTGTSQQWNTSSCWKRCSQEVLVQAGRMSPSRCTVGSSQDPAAVGTLRGCPAHWCFHSPLGTLFNTLKGSTAESTTWAKYTENRGWENDLKGV